MALKFKLKNIETLKSKVFELKKDGEFIIGRSEKCHIRVGDQKVSSMHLKLIVKSKTIMVEDLGSHNGIQIDGVTGQSGRIYVDTVVAFGVYRLKLVKEELTPNEMVINTKRFKEKNNNITMVVSKKDLDASKVGFNETILTQEAYVPNRKDLTLVKKVSKLKKRKS